MLDHLSDRQLARMCADGVDPAFDILAARYRPALLRQCARLLAHADAEEAVQETLLRAYVALSRGETVRRVGPWLRAIARHAAINVLRAQASRPLTVERADGPAVDEADRLERREHLHHVLRDVASLPRRQREALVMRALEDRSYAEIGSRLGVSSDAVRQLLSRARAAVRSRTAARSGIGR